MTFARENNLTIVVFAGCSPLFAPFANEHRPACMIAFFLFGVIFQRSNSNNYLCLMNKQEVFSINNDHQFTEAALQIFRYQAQNCTVYREFIKGLKIDPETVAAIDQVPFLPIEFFKSHRVLSSNDPIEITFTSS